MRSTLPTFNEIWQRKFRHRLLIQAQQFSADSVFLIGCSGGMDSMLLLHVMSELFPHNIRAIYIDHQLQSSSRAWGDFIQNFAQQRQIPVTIQPVDVEAGNLENQARQARYAAFLRHAQPNDILVLAHHQNDQAETVLLRLLSGTGVQGLAAMKEHDHIQTLRRWRPFLSLSRQQIQAWVDQLALPYVQDETNFDTRYDRAWCREQLWPLLEQRFPKMQDAVARTSVLMQDAQTILDEVLQQDLAATGSDNHLMLQTFLQLSTARQRQLLSFWMKGKETYRPSLDMVNRLQEEVIHAKADAQAALHWNGFYYVRYQQILHRIAHAAYTAQTLPQQQTLADLKLDHMLELSSGRYILKAADIGLSKALLARELTVLARQGGEKIHLYGRVGHWPLKKAIQDAQIFPWLRHTIQILLVDNVMLGVFTPNGFWLAQSDYCEVGGWQPYLISDVNHLRVEHNS
ncbi:tRNA lysidine(34) synthetase TilS [Acinetobacter soli]|uniref:tRNA lysidine(34) synthetase TilS n=1 Tax=Acinetobacter soli TaxID=487316 RepID=UPI0012507B85|nr:tRNA lysidine(34) synthetase TilS [Acinetobacter soli]WEH92109.1 tRNA lysidine(34) synthetase TilS [Acinetobacter soli]WEH98745.1 tRNA lysidine(34) synthetase TilS [Acinetobacter soli]WEI00663.1 tRNA lysidine(34) synthetase TilS [Acinetobacter soli]